MFYRLWVLLEQACHLLDIELAKRSAPLSADRESFSKYAEAMKDLAQLEEDKKELTAYLINLQSQLISIGSQMSQPQGHPLFIALQEEVQSTKARLRDMVKAIAHIGSNPSFTCCGRRVRSLP